MEMYVIVHERDFKKFELNTSFEWVPYIAQHPWIVFYDTFVILASITGESSLAISYIISSSIWNTRGDWFYHSSLEIFILQN